MLHPARPDETAYIQEIQPRLVSVTISTISRALGVCESYAADIRAGRHRPHPKHWLKLAELAGVSADLPLAEPAQSPNRSVWASKRLREREFV